MDAKTSAELMVPSISSASCRIIGLENNECSFAAGAPHTQSAPLPALNKENASASLPLLLPAGSDLSNATVAAIAARIVATHREAAADYSKTTTEITSGASTACPCPLRRTDSLSEAAAYSYAAVVASFTGLCFASEALAADYSARANACAAFGGVGGGVRSQQQQPMRTLTLPPIRLGTSTEVWGLSLGAVLAKALPPPVLSSLGRWRFTAALTLTVICCATDGTTSNCACGSDAKPLALLPAPVAAIGLLRKGQTKRPRFPYAFGQTASDGAATRGRWRAERERRREKRALRRAADAAAVDVEGIAAHSDAEERPKRSNHAEEPLDHHDACVAEGHRGQLDGSDVTFGRAQAAGDSAAYNGAVNTTAVTTVTVTVTAVGRPVFVCGVEGGCNNGHRRESRCHSASSQRRPSRLNLPYGSGVSSPTAVNAPFSSNPLHFASPPVTTASSIDSSGCSATPADAAAFRRYVRIRKARAGRSLLHRLVEPRGLVSVNGSPFTAYDSSFATAPSKSDRSSSRLSASSSSPGSSAWSPSSDETNTEEDDYEGGGYSSDALFEESPMDEAEAVHRAIHSCDTARYAVDAAGRELWPLCIDIGTLGLRMSEETAAAQQ